MDDDLKFIAMLIGGFVIIVGGLIAGGIHSDYRQSKCRQAVVEVCVGAPSMAECVRTACGD